MITPRLAVAATVLTLAIAVPSTLAAQGAHAQPSSASSQVRLVHSPSAAKKFANCTDVHKTYSAGIAKPGTKWNIVHHKGKPDEKRKIKGSPKSDAALYSANSKLDADKDGLACELS
ncbi:hypothetical protein AS850_08270 [Frondihabitans sp. 762G35]|uniref:excalibur calcium-binding domain-containing protein n=1 Tax=Frondihabitans sp. 762G35 TaxID=1446794 RepID=UPI000D220FF3|nr:excalibur calcium-binding domain-containing protein [Frondihabitans sp. 762G35]ARC57068.1 hypothetical protein AS850_08270 [Frondihabitans sp. 762G35]